MRNFIVTIDGKKYEVGVEEVGVTNTVTPVVNEVKPVEAVKPQQVENKQEVKPATTVTNGTKMEAPMPGMIKALKFNEGASVKAGDVVLVLEAMKMDNDITAPCDGVISYKAQVGATVNTGDVMAIIG